MCKESGVEIGSDLEMDMDVDIDRKRCRYRHKDTVIVISLHVMIDLTGIVLLSALFCCCVCFRTLFHVMLRCANISVSCRC